MIVDRPRIIITAPGSSSGKTLATMGIIYGLKRLGFRVKPFKIGPDFIDPSYLGAVAGVKAQNLDLWLMGKSGTLSAFCQGCLNSDACVIEGVMGYLDGAYTDNDRFFGSSYRVSQILKSNIVVVIDVSKVAQTALAIVLGLARFSKGKVGVILNRVAGDGHAEYVRRAIDGFKNIVYLGHIYEDKSLMLEERKLGLVPTAERQVDAVAIGKRVSERIDFNALLSLMGREPLNVNCAPQARKSYSVKVSVALDDAFNFYYWDTIDLLKSIGAEIEFFSPVNDIPPSESTNGIIIGGGFPELFAESLSGSTSNSRFLKRASEDGVPIIGECGGLMYLTRGIYVNEKFYPWVGAFDAGVKMTDDLTIGYSELEAKSSNPLSIQGQRIRGHEFHYSKIVEVSADQSTAFKVIRGYGIDGKNDGFMVHDTVGTYSHIHLGSNRGSAGRFLQHCAKSARR